MGQQERLNMILTQARIAKAALAENKPIERAVSNRHVEQAILAVEAIVLLADDDLHAQNGAV